MAIESKMARGPIGIRAPEPQQKPGKGWAVAVVVIVGVVGGGWYFYMGPGTGDQGLVEQIASGDYQAVFLDNGQVYFGKLERSRSDFFMLTDVFYLQSGVAVDQNTNLALTKLGSEAHGPVDRMEINQEHVLFIEDMKDDSKVVQAIQQYQSSK